MCKAASAVATPQDEVEIQTDSVLALLAAIGATRKNAKRKKTNPNELLTHKAREAYKNLQKQTKHKVVIRKIKAHAKHHWNELADELAAIGRTTELLQEPLKPIATAQLKERLNRALEAEGNTSTNENPPDVEVVGFGWG